MSVNRASLTSPHSWTLKRNELPFVGSLLSRRKKPHSVFRCGMQLVVNCQVIRAREEIQSCMAYPSSTTSVFVTSFAYECDVRTRSASDLYGSRETKLGPGSKRQLSLCRVFVCRHRYLWEKSASGDTSMFAPAADVLHQVVF